MGEMTCEMGSWGALQKCEGCDLRLPCPFAHEPFPVHSRDFPVCSSDGFSELHPVGPSAVPFSLSPLGFSVCSPGGKKCVLTGVSNLIFAVLVFPYMLPLLPSWCVAVALCGNSMTSCYQLPMPGLSA